MSFSSHRSNSWRSNSWRSNSWSRVLALACAAFFLGSLAGAQTLKLATIVPEGSLWDKALRQLGAGVARDTSGRVKFQIYPGGVAGDETDLIRKMRIGQLQAALISAPGMAEIDPAFNLFQVPLFFEDDAEVRLVLDGMRSVFEQRLLDKGFVLLHWGDTGWMRIFASKPIASLGDFRGLKQFVWGSETRLGTWYQELGLRPVSLSANDVLTGLQTGLIEALPVTPLAALSLQWFRSAPNMLDHRFAPLLGATIVTKAAWNKLDAADRETLRSLAGQTEAQLFEQVPREEAAALEEMRTRGLTVFAEREADKDAWLALSLQFQQRFRASSVPPAVFDQAVKLLERQRTGAER